MKSLRGCVVCQGSRLSPAGGTARAPEDRTVPTRVPRAICMRARYLAGRLCSAVWASMHGRSSRLERMLSRGRARRCKGTHTHTCETGTDAFTRTHAFARGTRTQQRKTSSLLLLWGCVFKAVLRVQGLSLHALGQFGAAVRVLDRASSMEPSNTQVAHRVRRAPAGG